MPDGTHFLFSAPTGLNSPSGGGTAILLGSLDGGEPRLVLDGESNAVYASGHILFLLERTLMARPFDLNTLELRGDAFPLAEDISYIGAASLGVFSVSQNGVLAYLSGQSESTNRLYWFDRKGEKIGVLGEKDNVFEPAISPDGQQVAMLIVGGSSFAANIWIHDIRRNTRTRFTFDKTSMNPTWSPDGKSLTFSSNRSGGFEIYRKSVSGSGEEEQLTKGGKAKLNHKWSPDGRYLAYVTLVDGLGGEIHVLDMKGNKTATPLRSSRFNEISPVFSPDGRWLAYCSDESGRFEAYIAAFSGGNGKPEVKGKWQISTSGGRSIAWRRDGREIYFEDNSRNLMSVEIRAAGETLELGTPQKLMNMTASANNLTLYDVTDNGQKFLFAVAETANTLPPLTLVVNWTAGIKRKE